MNITLKDIARLTGTSLTAVSFVLNGKGDKRVGSEKSKAILDVARKFGYQKNIAARGLVLRQTFRVGICIYGAFSKYPVYGNRSIIYESVNLLSGKLHKFGYSINILEMDTGSSTDDFVGTLIQDRLDGVILLAWPDRPAKQLLSILANRGIAACAQSSKLTKEYSWATFDRELAAYKGVTYLLSNEYKKIQMLSFKRRNSELFRRGYCKAMQEAGCDPLPIHSIDETFQSVIETVKEVLDLFPDMEAAFIPDNFFALSVVNMLYERGIRVVGVGRPYYANICFPKMTYLNVPSESLVDFCVQMLMDQIESPQSYQHRQHVFECDLVVQGT